MQKVMGQNRDRIDNGSYLYKLNQELSGEKTITPYFEELGMVQEPVDMGEVREGELSGSVYED